MAGIFGDDKEDRYFENELISKEEVIFEFHDKVMNLTINERIELVLDIRYAKLDIFRDITELKLDKVLLFVNGDKHPKSFGIELLEMYDITETDILNNLMGEG